MAKIKAKYIKPDVPTDKQIEFAESISDDLEIPLPKEFTKQAYSEFITEWKDDYYNQHDYFDNFRS